LGGGIQIIIVSRIREKVPLFIVLHNILTRKTPRIQGVLLGLNVSHERSNLMLFRVVTYISHVSIPMYFKVKLILLQGLVNICGASGRLILVDKTDSESSHSTPSSLSARASVSFQNDDNRHCLTSVKIGRLELQVGLLLLNTTITFLTRESSGL